MTKQIPFRNIKLGEWFKIRLEYLSYNQSGEYIGIRINKPNINCILEAHTEFSFKGKIRNDEMVWRVSPEEKAELL